MRRLFSFVFVLGLALSLCTIPAHAEEITLSSGDVVISHAVNSSPSDWTEEDLLKAATAPSPPPPKVGDAPQVKLQEAPVTGPPVSWPASNPDNKPIPNLGSPEQIGTTEACPASSYDWGWVGDHTEYPFRVVGKLIAHTSAGDMQCSASLINPKLVITAAHCVANGKGSWYLGFLFAPAYKDSYAPYGWHGVRDIWVFKTFLYNGDMARDVAVIFLQEPLGSQIGYLGFSAGRSPNQTWTQIGYPGETGFRGEPFDGTDQVWNRSGLGYYYADCDPPQLAAGTSMTPGSSGGPWMLWNDMKVNGVISRGGPPLGCPFMFTTPYFDSLIGQMILAARDAQ